MKIFTPHVALPTGKHRGGTTSKNLLGVSMVAFAIVLALVGTGTTYALLNSADSITGATITAGSTSITVNSESSSTLDANVKPLTPGESIVTPVTIANTGTTPAEVYVSSTIINSQTNHIASHLSLRFEPAEKCVTTTAGGTSMGTFTTQPLRMESGASANYCLEIFLAAEAPASVQGGTATFTLLLDADQVPR